MLKLNKDSAVGTFVIIIAFCLVCSVLVSSAVVALGPFQQAAIANDRQVNILKVSGYDVETTVADTYAKHIEARMIDVASGNIVPEMQAQADGYNFASAAKQAGASEAIPADKDIAKNVEKAKSKYAGHELKGKKVAVIGLGVIGVLVANSLIDLGMNVIGYDPFLSIGNAMKLHKEVKYVEALEDCVKDCDYVTIHVPLNPNTKHMLNKKIFEAFKDNTILINFSRDTLVCDDDLQWALNNSKVSKYVTDFANEQVVKLDNVICLPHLGASTAEAEDNCALMAINQLRDYLENGNILNSVNYPDLNASIKQGQIRVCINHKNVVGMIAKFSSIISDNGGNILTLTNKSRNDFAYTVIDVDKNINVENIEKLEGVLRVRVI